MRAAGQRRWIAATVIVVAVIAACIWLSGGSVPQGSVLSPDRRYRVDFRTATRWQWLTHVQRLEDPGTAVVVRMADHRASRSSGVLTLADSPVTWLPNGVLIGTQARYGFGTEQWE